MNHWLLKVKYLAVKQLLWSRLKVVLEQDSTTKMMLDQLSHIPLNRVKDKRRILYSSAIALRLGSIQNVPAAEIAQAIAYNYRQLESSQLDFTVQVVSSGLIYWEFTESKLAVWLQNICSSPFFPHTTSCSPHPLCHSLFSIQYAHARCCSLLQMAAREELITLKQTNSASSPVWLIAVPNPLPWLNCEQKLCLSHPAEQSLIHCLLGIFDDLYCSTKQLVNWHKTALNLSQAFQTFYNCCQIWGEVKRNHLPLCQARLGLVLITQSVLRSLLQDILTIAAPLEL